MSELPRLSREVVTSLAFATRTDIDVPTPELLGLPERVVQFGTGGFLRGFVEYFIDEANRRGTFAGTVVAVSSTGTSRDATLNEQDGLFTLAIQGMEEGSARRRYRIVSSLGRALSARDDWDAVLDLARDPAIDLVVSNTTEVGIVYDAADAFDDRPPRSFPGKLTRFLFERAASVGFEPAQGGVVVIPCELIEDNGTVLRGIVERLAAEWSLDPRFAVWLATSATFCNTLVDRIVPGTPAPNDVERAEHLFGYRDGLLTSCESYALFAIEGDEALRRRLGFAVGDARVIVAPDIRPYRERKVRILNGGHTVMVPAALLAGLETVRDAVADERIGQFLRRAMLEEIVPALDVPDARAFANEVLERFANPFIRHALIDITLHGTTKMRVRVVPSIVQFARRFGRVPGTLALGFAAYIAFMRGDLHLERQSAGLAVPSDNEGTVVRDAWRNVDESSDGALLALADRICRDTALWHCDLSGIDGFAASVGDHLVRIVRGGIGAALDVHLNAPVSALS